MAEPKAMAAGTQPVQGVREARIAARREPAGLARIPLLSYGFRPFFLGAALWAAASMLLWLGVVTGAWSIAEGYGAVAWHAHELLIGYMSAVIAGFLLTAIPNWTGRLPVRGGPLLLLFLLWAAGRLALLAGDLVGMVPAMAVDSLFLAAFALAILREILASRNLRNLKTVALVSLLAAANAGFHAEVYFFGNPEYSLRAAVAAVIGLIMLIGGRVVPSFTRNWLVRHDHKRLPEPFGRFDAWSVAASGLALAAWAIAPASWPAGVGLLAAGLLQAARLYRWAGEATWREPLVLVLHVAYAFVPLGFLLVGIAVLWPAAIAASGALHAWTAGAMALMSLAMMTRATLGHTGGALVASAATRLIYLAALAAVLARIAASLFPDASIELLLLAAIGWLAAFGGFVIAYGPRLSGSSPAS